MVEVENYELHKYMTTDDLGQDVMHVSGIAKIELDNPNDNANWYEHIVEIPLDTEKWLEYSNVLVPHVALGSISNHSHAVHAGWAVNKTEAHEINDIPHIRATLGIRDKDGDLHRVNFTAIVVGVKAEDSMVNRLQVVPRFILEKALKVSIDKKNN